MAAPCPTLSRLATEGVLLHRMEDEDALYCGVKDLYAFMVVEQGRSELAHAGRTHDVGPGDVVLAQPGELYRDLRRDGPATFDIVLFDHPHIERLAPRGLLIFPSPRLAPGDPRALPLLALRAALLRPSSTPLEREVAIAEASAAMVAAGESEARAPRERPAIARARAYLRDRLADRVRLDDLADHVRLDKYHLIRAFRAQVGVPPYEYLTHLRMARARELLRNGVTPAEAAAALGYCDQSQLHRHFVRIVGTTPGLFASSEAWRRAAQ
jgi:AraC-like DNA-binding protein